MCLGASSRVEKAVLSFYTFNFQCMRRTFLIVRMGFFNKCHLGNIKAQNVFERDGFEGSGSLWTSCSNFITACAHLFRYNNELCNITLENNCCKWCL